MGDFLSGLRALLGGGQDEEQGVRPDYGLTGAQLRPMQKSPYEPTLEPGETRTPEEIQSMLGGVIEAAGMAAVPGVGPRQMEMRPPGSRRVPDASIRNPNLQDRAVRRAGKAAAAGGVDVRDLQDWELKRNAYNYRSGDEFARLRREALAELERRGLSVGDKEIPYEGLLGTIK